MNIGIVGNGVVGNATRKAWTGHCDEVRVYDSNPLRTRNSLESVLECDFVFVCLPTPQKPDGKGIDTSALSNFFASAPRSPNYVVKSTVSIGYTRRLASLCPNVVHSSEFLTERTADRDAAIPRINVVGTAEGTDGDDMFPPLAQLYRRRWPNTEWLLLTFEESEAMKLVMNSWFAVKVAFWNEVRTMCDAMRLNYREVRDAIVDEGRVNELHTHVPGPDGKFGFGGKCLPKDLSELVRTMDALGLQPGVMRAAYDRNELLDRPRPTESR